MSQKRPVSLAPAAGFDPAEWRSRVDCAAGHHLLELYGLTDLVEGVLALRVEGQLVSRPYVHMTLQVMKDFGVELDAGDGSQFRTAGGQHYGARSYVVEPDASAASYFWAAAAITRGGYSSRV